MAASTKFEGSLSKEQFTNLLLNQNLLDSNIDQKNDPPSIEEMCEMFEFIDEDRTGMISANDLIGFLELSERLKLAQFD